MVTTASIHIICLPEKIWWPQSVITSQHMEKMEADLKSLHNWEITKNNSH